MSGRYEKVRYKSSELGPKNIRLYSELLSPLKKNKYRKKPKKTIMKVYVLLGVLAFAALTLAEDCEFEGDQWTVAPERYQETFYQSGKFMRRWAKKIVNGGVFITMTGHCVDAGDVGDECDATADSTCGDGRTCCATGFHAVG